jgi:Fe-S cluster assembly protein SufD
MSFIQETTDKFSQLIAGREGRDRFMRESAWEAFIARGLPTRKVENWRYTNLRLLDTLKPDLSENLPLFSEFYTIIMVDGVYDPSQSQCEIEGLSIESGVECQASQIDPDKHPLAVLNLALSENILDIKIAPGFVIDKPIILVQQGSEQSQFIQYHITLGEGSKASFISQSNKASSSNILVQLKLEKNAQCGYYSVNNHQTDSIHIEAVHVEQDKGSSLEAFILATGSRVSRVDLSTTYLGEQASSHVTGVCSLNNKQHSDIHLNAEHVAPHCNTVQSVRTVVEDSARAVFNGRVCVHEKAIKSTSQQSNHNLMLSNTCEVDTKPELEIYNDDVKCAHGATVGQLDQDALFYLMARGISKGSALSILREAFLAQQFESITDQAISSFMLRMSR